MKALNKVLTKFLRGGEGMEKILIIYEEHNATHTDAYTSFSFDPKPLSEPKRIGGGTHKRYMTIVQKNTIAKIVRRSNRGNLRVMKIKIDTPVYIDFLGNCFALEEEDYELARTLNLI
ncbi:MAG: hypothetical protein ABIL37_01215 [candidate division WOR-3 bacterium]